MPRGAVHHGGRKSVFVDSRDLVGSFPSCLIRDQTCCFLSDFKFQTQKGDWDIILCVAFFLSERFLDHNSED